MESINFTQLTTAVFTPLTKALKKKISSLHETKAQSKEFAAEKAVVQKQVHIKNDMLKQIQDIKGKINVIRCCYNLETNFDLIDSYIMQLNSLEHRYDFLIKQAKQKGIVAFDPELTYNTNSRLV